MKVVAAFETNNLKHKLTYTQGRVPTTTSYAVPFSGEPREEEEQRSAP